MRFAKKGLSVFLAMLMVFGTFAVGGAGLALTASAAETGKAIRLVTNGAADFITGAQTSNVWFGNYMQSSADSKEPVKWRVLSNADGKLLLLSDQNLDVVRYNETSTSVTWETCTLRKWLNGYDGHPYDDAFIGSAFNEKELSAVAESELENADNPRQGTSGGNNTTDKVFLLSIAEATNTAYGFTDNGARLSTDTAYVAAGGHTGGNMYGGVGEPDSWRLRSPGIFSTGAASVDLYGFVFDIGSGVNYDRVAVRPAFNLDLKSVLFTSAAAGGKSGDGLTAVDEYTGSDWKLTFLDESRSDFTASFGGAQDDVYTISYNGATTGENEKISAMIVSGDGVCTYYGILGDAQTGENTVTVDLAGKLHDGDKLYVFNEQANGDKKTDFSSALVDVTPTIMSDLTVNKADLKTDLNTSDARTIWYGGSAWRVIGYDGAGVASESGTMTLFANAGMGTSYFDFDGKTGRQYAGSDLEKQTNQIYNNAFSDPEQLAVRDRTLNAGTYDGANTDGVQGSSVGYARLWPLSTKEANAVSADLRVDTGAWWLRSPGDGGNNVAFVKKEGDVDHIGQSFLSSSGVRPAFMVDLDKVIFASAAVGGKRGDGALTPVEDSIGGECKLTLWESRRQWFSVTETEAAGYAGETVTLHYKYAETGENEYISAILTDKNGTALYYGRIAPATIEDGTVDITIPTDLPGGSYTLKVFNEQYNGYKKTDFSSPLIDVALTVYAGNGKALQMTENGAAANIIGAQTSNVWFGNYKQSGDGAGGFNVDPIKWRVLQNKDGRLFLLTDQSIDAVQFNETDGRFTWETSTMRSWLNGYDDTKNADGRDYTNDSFRGDAFTAAEYAAVTQTTVVNAADPDFYAPGSNDTTDKVFLLSAADVVNEDYGFPAETVTYSGVHDREITDTAYAADREKNAAEPTYSFDDGAQLWWLRTLGEDGRGFCYVDTFGNLRFSTQLLYPNWTIGVRPAVNVDLGKVLFTSAAKGGKQGDGLTAVPGYNGADWKLTLLDDSRADFTASGVYRHGDVRTIRYSGATVGENEKISAMIVSAAGAVTYYGVLCDAAAGENMITIDATGKLSDGDKLYVFNEQTNGDYKTDYASALVDVTAAEPAFKATFKADGTVVGEVLFTAGTTSIKDQEPTVPAKTGHTGAWQAYTLGAQDITIEAVYTPNTYTAMAVADGQVLAQIPFTYGQKSVQLPKIPDKTGYTAAWPSYTLGAQDITITAVYTPIQYTATFVADGEVVGTESFIVTQESIHEPAVPAKEGYAGAWPSYTLGAKDITIEAVYTPKTFTVNWIVDGKTTTVSVSFGSAIEKPADPQKDGYAFTGWDAAIPATMPAHDLTFTAQFEEIAAAVTLTGLTVKKQPNKTVYTYKNDKNLDLAGLELEAAYSDGTVKAVDPAACRITGYSAKPRGDKTITVEYEGQTAQFKVTVKYAWWQWLIRIFLLGFIWY